MFNKVFMLAAAALVLACDAKIEIPGFEDLPKCLETDLACVKASTNKINQLLSKPFPKYSIKGYDPFSIKKLELIDDEYLIDQYLTDIEVTGFGGPNDVVDIAYQVGSDKVKITYENTLKLTAKAKAVFRTTPQVVREGVISGEFVGVRSEFSYPVKKNLKDGNVFLEIGPEQLLSVVTPTKPNLNAEQYATFINHPDTQALVKKVTENAVAFYQKLAAAVVKEASPQIFEDKRNFYKNVPLTELWRKE